MKISKILCALLVILLLLPVAACKKPATPSPSPVITEKPIELPVYDFGGREFKLFLQGHNSNNPWKREDEPTARMRARVDYIEDKCNAKVTFVSDGTWNGYVSMLPAIMAGSPPADVMDGQGPHQIVDQINKQLIEPVDEFDEIFDLENPDLWEQSIQDSYRLADKLWGIVPRYVGSGKQMETVVMFFNKTLLTESGVTDNLYDLQKNKQWTWDKFAEIALKITRDKNGDGKTDIWGAGGNNEKLMLGFINANGGKLFGIDEKNQPNLLMDKPAARTAFQFLVDMAVKQKSLRPRPDEEGSPIDMPMFRNGLMGFVPEHLNRIDPDIGGISSMKNDFGVLLFPIANGKTDYVISMNYFNNRVMVKGAEDKESVAKFMNVLFRPMFTDMENEEVFDEPLTANLRDQESVETVHMMTDDLYTVDQSSYYVVGGTDTDSTFIIIDGSEPVFRGEKTVQQFFDENIPVIKDRLTKCWTNIFPDYAP